MNHYIGDTREVKFNGNRAYAGYTVWWIVT